MKLTKKRLQEKKKSDESWSGKKKRNEETNQKSLSFFGRYYLTYRVDPAPDFYPRNTHI